jgi:alpha-glucosidase
MLLNASDTNKRMQIEWKELGLEPNAASRDIWAHRDLGFSKGFTHLVAPHSAILLRVQGTRSWVRGITFEAESPSNLRIGNARLLACGECSSGYAMMVGGDARTGAITFQHIHIDQPGTYEMHLVYVRNGLEDKTLTLSINGDSARQVKAIMRSWNDMVVSVPLKAGNNDISIGYSGLLPFDLDRIELSRNLSVQ